MTQVRNVSKGARGADVFAIQAALNYHIRKAGPQLETDGIFGRRTDERLRIFQKFNRLVPDGIVGPLTRRMLFRFGTSQIDLQSSALDVERRGSPARPLAFTGAGTPGGDQNTETRRTILLPKDVFAFPKLPVFDFPHFSIPASPVLIVPPVIIPPDPPGPRVERKPPVIVAPVKLEWDFSPFQKPDDDIDPRKDADINFDQKFKFVLHYPIPNPGADPANKIDPNKDPKDEEKEQTEFSLESGQQPGGRWRFKAGAETTIKSFKVIGPLQLEIYSKAELTLPTGKTEITGGSRLSFKPFDALEITAGPSVKMEVDPRAATVKVSPDLGGAGSLDLQLNF
jgi:peptidoglycan hydrolase-like protein with peptidoglycan-binding domain